MTILKAKVNGTWLPVGAAAVQGPPGPQGPPGGAPTNAQYLVLALDPTLSQERQLVAGTGISLVDGGAGGTLTISTSAAAGAPADATYVVIGPTASLTNERVLTAGAGLALADGGVNQPVTLSIPPAGVTSAMFRSSAGFTVLGRSDTSTGPVVDIQAALDGQVLRRAGAALAFGALDLANASAVTGVLPAARGGTGSTAGVPTLPLAVAQGGTGATSQAGAQATLNIQPKLALGEWLQWSGQNGIRKMTTGDGRMEIDAGTSHLEILGTYGAAINNNAWYHAKNTTANYIRCIGVDAGNNIVIDEQAQSALIKTRATIMVEGRGTGDSQLQIITNSPGLPFLELHRGGAVRYAFGAGADNYCRLSESWAPDTTGQMFAANSSLFWLFPELRPQNGILIPNLKDLRFLDTFGGSRQVVTLWNDNQVYVGAPGLNLQLRETAYFANDLVLNNTRWVREGPYYLFGSHNGILHLAWNENLAVHAGGAGATTFYGPVTFQSTVSGVSGTIRAAGVITSGGGVLAAVGCTVVREGPGRYLISVTTGHPSGVLPVACIANGTTGNYPPTVEQISGTQCRVHTFSTATFRQDMAFSFVIA